jgi:pimeloyl-ACP methyl ester carboxylesterase
MDKVISADGTKIAFERMGTGPAVILVDGAMCHWRSGPMQPIGALLQDGFTIYGYDRRGRGESGDTLPYSVDREVEDLRALVAAAGGSANVFAISSGAALVLTAAAAGVPLAKLALYEPPFLSDFGGGAAKKEYGDRLAGLLADGRRGDAAALFMSFVGMPPEAIDGLRAQPFWSRFEAIAPTLAYDDAVLGDGSVPVPVAASIAVPTLLLDGGSSPQTLRAATEATAKAIPGARYRTLEGQTHDVAADAIAPVLIEFFGS